MKKTILNTAIAVALSGGALVAASVEAATLNIDQGSRFTTSYQVNSNTFTTDHVSGSWFSIDIDSDGLIFQDEKNIIGGFNGLVVDGVTTQAASGSHAGLPGCAYDAEACSVGYVASVIDNPNTPEDEAVAAIPGVDFTEAPDIDNPWTLLGQTGMHQTTSPVSTLSNDGAGNVTLDFLGWGATWNSIPSIPLGGDPANFNPALNTGIATMSCYTSIAYSTASGGNVYGAATDCVDGAIYELDYVANIPANDISGFGGISYAAHLEGTISGDLPSAVPVPAAAWLFGSGLMGLIGIARRKKS